MKGAAIGWLQDSDGRAAILAALGSKDDRVAPNPNHSELESVVAPPGAWTPLRRLLKIAQRPLDRFLEIEAASGIVLLAAAALALIWSNSPWSDSYFALWHTPLGLSVGDRHIERSLEWLVNDGLMAIFFFVVGMEIRRELDHGELSQWRRAALPFAAALGGMLAPALIYLTVASAASTRSGWGIPMATDIAFAVGILTLLGKRVPPALRVLLLALAVIDDLGAILVIALFYSSGVSLTGLVMAALGLLGILALQAFGIRQRALYLPPALVVWAGTYAAGIHPTIAGVVIGMLTPVTVWFGPGEFVRRVRLHLDSLDEQPLESMAPQALHQTLRQIGVARREALSPAEDLIQRLHPWVAYLIMPAFALANAGVKLDALGLTGESSRIALGIALGLLLGKPIGILLACESVLRLGVAALPHGIGRRHLLVLGAVAGIGFTMSLFIGQLAFGQASLLGAAKLGVLIASAAAALIGISLGRQLLAPDAPKAIALTADEAEDSTEQ